MTKVQKVIKKSTSERRAELLEIITDPSKSFDYYSAIFDAMKCYGTKRTIPRNHYDALQNLRLFFLESELLHLENKKIQAKEAAN